jgi:hypothetical protein
MLEPPSLADNTILAALRAHYGIAGAVLTFLPIGNDSASSTSPWLASYRLLSRASGVLADAGRVRGV